MCSEIEIKSPSVDLFLSFMLFVEDMTANQQTVWSPYLPQEKESPIEFVERQLGRERNPAPHLVPETVYWGVYQSQVIGRISLRHRLEGNLFKIGGHVGYEVGPRWRRRGFATEMLRQVIETPKAQEIGRILLTCSPENEASNKTIIANHGVLEKKVFVDSIGEFRNHYWIG